MPDLPRHSFCILKEMATGARILFNDLGVTLIEKMGHIGIDSRPLS
jgi:hypothetical protein